MREREWSEREDPKEKKRACTRGAVEGSHTLMGAHKTLEYLVSPFI